MGQNRIQTISNALRVPELQDQLLELYRDRKLNKLQPELQLSADEFAKASQQIDEFLRCELNLGITLGQPKNFAALIDKSETGRALAAEHLLEADYCEAEFRNETKFSECVRQLAQMLFVHQGTSEPLVKETIVASLADLYASFDVEHRDERFARVLTVAIGLQYSGSPTDDIHREQVSRFADALFSAKPKWIFAESGRECHDALARAIKEMLIESKRVESAQLLLEAREALGLSPE